MGFGEIEEEVGDGCGTAEEAFGDGGCGGGGRVVGDEDLEGLCEMGWRIDEWEFVDLFWVGWCEAGFRAHHGEGVVIVGWGGGEG